MTRPIADDFPAIRARLDSIRADEGAAPADRWSGLPPPEPADPARPADFHAWLMGGGLWVAPSSP